MPRARFNDDNVTMSSSREYPHMIVELLDENGKGECYLGPGDKVAHFTGDVEAINVTRNPSSHNARTQTIELAENIEFDAGADVILKVDDSGFFFTQEKTARFYYEYY